MKNEKQLRNKIEAFTDLVSTWVLKNKIKSYKQLWKSAPAFNREHSVDLSMFKKLIDSGVVSADIFELLFSVK